MKKNKREKTEKHNKRWARNHPEQFKKARRKTMHNLLNNLVEDLEKNKA